MPPGMSAGTEYRVLTPEEQAALDAAAAEAAAQQVAPAPGLGGGGYEVAPPPVEQAVPVDPQYQVAPPTDYIPGSTYSPQPVQSAPVPSMEQQLQAQLDAPMGTPQSASLAPAPTAPTAQPAVGIGHGSVEVGDPVYGSAPGYGHERRPTDPSAYSDILPLSPYPVSDPNPPPSTLNATAAHGGINQGSGVPYEQGRSNLDVSQQQNARRIYGFQQEQDAPPPYQPVEPRAVGTNGAITLPAPNIDIGMNPLDFFTQGADAAERYSRDDRQRELEARYAPPPASSYGVSDPPSSNPAYPSASDSSPSGRSFAEATGLSEAGLPSEDAELRERERELRARYTPPPPPSRGGPLDAVGALMGGAGQTLSDARSGIEHPEEALATTFGFDPANPETDVTSQLSGAVSDFLGDSADELLRTGGRIGATAGDIFWRGGRNLAAPFVGTGPGTVVGDLEDLTGYLGMPLRQAQSTTNPLGAWAAEHLRDPSVALADEAMNTAVGDKITDFMNFPLPSFGMPAPSSDDALLARMTGINPQKAGQDAGLKLRGELDAMQQRGRGAGLRASLDGANQRDVLAAALQGGLSGATPPSLSLDPLRDAVAGTQARYAPGPDSLPTPDPAMLDGGAHFDMSFLWNGDRAAEMQALYGVEPPAAGPLDQIGQWGGDRLNDVRGVLPQYEVSPPNVAMPAGLGQWGGDRLNDVQGAIGDYAVSPPSVSLPDLSLPTGDAVRAQAGRIGTAIQGLPRPGADHTAVGTMSGAPAFGWDAARTALQGGGATNDPLAQVFAEDAAANPDGEVTISNEAGVDWVKNAQGEYVGLVDPSTGEPVRFPDGSSDAEKDAFVAEIRAKAPAAEQPPATASDTAPIKTIGAEPDYTVESPAEETYSSGGGNQGSYSSNNYANDYSSSFSKDDYGYDYDARKSSGYSYDDDDDGGFDLKLEDFLKDFDGDGTIGSKDRSMAKKAFMSARSKRGKKAKSSSFDPFNRPESPLRTQILDELDAALPKGAPARRKQRR
jgi:hypothetical protein